ncbi:MAG: glycosyltransferase [Candidatus Nanoarchaeia archaeon]|nr:glycosyltransferase [Candidatus Nanoarchaeia archaeon]
MDNIGGAEFVDLILAKELNADIYTTNIDKEKIQKMGFSTDNIYSIGKIPINAPFRQEFAYWRFRKLNLKNKYDFYIIAGDWAVSAAFNNKPNLWYVYSPKREIWDLYDYVRINTVPWHKRLIFDVWVFIRRILDKRDVKNVQKIICISKNVQNRVKKYLNRDSKIIYPPTENKDFYYNKSKGYWLSVNRLIEHKRVDIQLKAFAKIPDEKLIIIGSYEKSSHFQKYAEYCKKIKPQNVEIRSWVDKKELTELYANCKGVIATSKDEDYGMNVVEAMASGKPVIASNEGGFKETLINEKTGILIDHIDEEKLIEAIKIFGEKIEKNPLRLKNLCQKQAKNFDTKIFIKKFKEEIKNEKTGFSDSSR